CRGACPCRSRAALRAGQEAAQLTEELLGPRVDAARNLDLHRDVEVAASLAGQTWQAAAAQAPDLASLGSRRHPELGHAFQRANGHATAEHGLADRDGGLRVEIVALAREARVVLHARNQNEVAAGAAERPRVSLAGHTDLCPGLHARGHEDGHGAAARGDPAATAAWARIRGRP